MVALFAILIFVYFCLEFAFYRKRKKRKCALKEIANKAAARIEAIRENELVKLDAAIAALSEKRQKAQSIDGLIPIGESTVYTKQVVSTYYSPDDKRFYMSEDSLTIVSTKLGKHRSEMDRLFNIATTDPYKEIDARKEAANIVNFPGDSSRQ